MKVVFWSEEGACGTTSNMLAAASMLSSRYAYRSLLIPAEKSGRDIVDNFSCAEGDVVKEDCAYYALEGMDYLMTAGKYGGLTEHHVKESMRTIVEERLYCLPQGGRLLFDYYPEESGKILNQVIELSSHMVDFSFIDCGNRKDRWTKDQMKNADLIVVNFKQEPQGLDHFFLNNSNISKKVIYFISSYQKESIYNKKNIHRIYRIDPEKLGVIPYNPEFQLACEQGRLDKYMKGKKILLPTDMRQYFFEELERSMQILIQNLIDAGERTKNNNKAGVGGAGEQPCESDPKKESL